MSNDKQTAVEWLGMEMGKLFAQYHGKIICIGEFHQKRFELENQAKEMEEKQKGYTLEQMMDCWNAALKFEPHGSNFIDYITGLKKENK